MKERLCSYCHEPLDPDAHGNQRMHPRCAYKYKKMRQKEKYQIGNSAKLQIQKNEAVLARIYKIDPDKNGISYLKALEYGLKFDCSCTKVENPFINNTIFMFDKYGYCIKEMKNQTLITVYHVSEL